ncbi:MAG: hypothetical protein AAB617_02780 [Patescibacteria group bacterium]
MTRVEMYRFGRKFIKKNGKFLLLFDVVGSKILGPEIGHRKMWKLMDNFMKRVNKKFPEHIVSGPLALKELRGFKRINSDGGIGFVSSVEVIDLIIEFSEKHLPFRLSWGVAEDEWDERCKRIVC